MYFVVLTLAEHLDYDMSTGFKELEVSEEIGFCLTKMSATGALLKLETDKLTFSSCVDCAVLHELYTRNVSPCSRTQHIQWRLEGLEHFI